MTGKIVPRPCACGCGGMTRGGDLMSGHGSRLYNAVIHHVGGTANLPRVVEAQTGRTVKLGI